MLRRPNTFRKYQEADDTQAASRDSSSIPRCSIGLKRSVNGNGTFASLVSFAVGHRPASVALGDLDGDGDLDACVANGSDDNVSVLLNQIFP